MKRDANNLEAAWRQTLDILAGQVTKATFNTHIKPLRAVSSDDRTLVLTCPATRLDWTSHRLEKPILAALKTTLPGVDTLKFRAADQPDAPPHSASEGDTLALTGAYHLPHNKIIKPDKVEVHTQYFRLNWRPLLGPLLSELIRELRQRCYYGRGENEARRNTVDVTLTELAAALGVSRSTVARALRRNNAGLFENRWLPYFIEDMTPIREYDLKKGKIVNVGTTFSVYLDEPLTPDDEQKLSEK